MKIKYYFNEKITVIYLHIIFLAKKTLIFDLDETLVHCQD